MDLDGKITIVTGAGSGIGKAAAKLFYQHGARVVVADVNEAAANEVAESLGERAIAAKADVSSAADVERMVTSTLLKWNRIDVLVNNAGFGKTGNVVSVTEDDWDRLFAVNVKGVFLCSKHVIPEMAKTGGGVIVNTSSYTSMSAISDRVAYVATKGAVSAMTRAMAMDHAKDGIRVNAVAPGTIDSPYFEAIFAKADDPAKLRAEYCARAVMNRMGNADEIAEAILFLASDRSSFATGSVMTIDGGSSIGNHLVR